MTSKPNNLSELAEAADALNVEGLYISFYLEGGRHIHRTHLAIIDALQPYLVYDQPWDAKRATALLDCDPSLFSEQDVRLAVRALWKTDREDFYWRAKTLYKSGWIGALLRSLGDLKPENAIVPVYPDVSKADYLSFPASCWEGFTGYWAHS
ncbi:hypothetical protein [Neptuniibacter sp. QD37_11]|uniref:hypothetical protein n=1 Tax=Neptuniibacter sp. QD37_11 TaxID=3398209 RepID=UPI0039F45A26